MKTSQFIIALIIFISCSQSRTGKDELKDTLTVENFETVNDSTTKHQTGQVLPQRLDKWNSLQEVHKDWILVKRDEPGYLVYKPCEGTTPRIKIENNKITILWQSGSPTTMTLEKFTRTYNKSGLYIWSMGQGVTSEFDVKIVDPEKKLALWKFYISEKQRLPLTYDFKWVMTPIEFAGEFREVDNPCPDGKKPEKEFLPVEFE